MAWEVVIGLETHVELSTKTKIFCSCSTAFGGEENSQCCPVCTGMPGALPVFNRSVLDFSLRTALALNCKVNTYQRFDRKNYFYPDLPKAYQISQLYLPMGEEGYVDLEGKRIRIRELHMEEDAGKLTHLDKHSRVDFNRCGVPLIEIVTYPDFRTAEEVVEYLEKLKSMLEYLGVSDCKMEEGSLRCDVNLSVRPVGSDTLGVRTEMKNLASFRAITKAIEYESRRQIALLERGREVELESRRWDEEKELTFSMRTKESARDYRYFPDPDLPPITLTEDEVRLAQQSLPEFADARIARYEKDYSLPSYDCKLLTLQPAVAEFFEACVALGAPAKTVSNWILGDLFRLQKEHKLEGKELGITPEFLVSIIGMVEQRRINLGTAAQVLKAIFRTGTDPVTYVKEQGLEQIEDTSLVESAVRQTMADHPNAVADYRAGKTKSFGFLVGQTMRSLKGQGDPAAVNQILRQLLEE